MSTRRALLEDGTNRILLEDWTNFLLKDDSVAQASDDVLLRLGPGLDGATGSGILAPAFTSSTPPGGTAVTSPFYYNMMSQWFEAA